MAEGEYRVELAVREGTMTHTYTLGDYLREEDALSGETVGRFRVGAGPLARGRMEAQPAAAGGGSR
jgi:hypothetical protein